MMEALAPMNDVLQERWSQVLAHTDYEKCERARGEDLNLKGIEWLLTAVRHPERKQPLFHVAGSKGKGTVAHFLERGLRMMGKKTMLYTSPHLSDWRERICINGEPASDDIWARSLESVLRFVTPSCTFFDIMTAAACVTSEQVSTASVYETGLGGRFDSTNAMIGKNVCVVTSIELEHTDVLGNDILQIAREKAAIFKEGATCWSGLPLLHPAQPILEEAAAKVGQVLRKPSFRPLAPDFPHPQEHMWNNYVLAMEILEDHFQKCGKYDSAEQGPFAVPGTELSIPGHYEERFTPDGRLVIFDTAHSADSLRALLQSFEQDFCFENCGVVFALRDDKDPEVLARQLADVIAEAFPGKTKWFTAPAGNHPRSADPKKLAPLFNATPLDKPEFPSGPDVLLVTGSTYLVGALRPLTTPLPDSRR